MMNVRENSGERMTEDFTKIMVYINVIVYISVDCRSVLVVLSHPNKPFSSKSSSGSCLKPYM